MSEPLSESDQSLLEEIEVLKTILFSELDITYTESGRPTQLSTTLYPSTAHDANQQYVCLTLVMKFPPEYPDEKPFIDLRNPRGLGDDFLANVFKLCQEKCDQFTGCPVIYEIIELIRESLTNSNKPTGHCTICLFEFHSDDVFTYTPCYHHFHSHCLSRFCENLQRQWKEEEDQEAAHNPNAALMKDKKPKNFTCPVCREVINVDLDALQQAPPPFEVRNFNEVFQADENFKAWKKEMDEAYQKQKAKGGIIDREAEDNRFLVVTDLPSNGSSSEPPSSPSTEEQPEPSQSSQTKETPSDTKQPPSAAHHKYHRSHRNYHHDQRHRHEQDHRQQHGQKRWTNQQRPQNRPPQSFQERPKFEQDKPKREVPDQGKQQAVQQPSKSYKQQDTKQLQEGGPQLLPHLQTEPNQRNQQPRNDDQKRERYRFQRAPMHANQRSEEKANAAVAKPLQKEANPPAERSVTTNPIGHGQSQPRPRPPPGFTPR